jgi:hypothetical protein
MMKKVAQAISLLVVCASVLLAQSNYRSGAEAILVDVSVQDRHGQPVRGLTAADFELRDNGVSQLLSDASVESTPIALALLIDQSRSVDDPAISQRISATVAEISGMLRPGDRLHLLGFASTVRLLGSGAGPADPERPAMRQTALFDALTAVLMRTHTVGFRHLVVVLTDGVDTVSQLAQSLRALVFDRAQATVYIVSIAEVRRFLTFGGFGGSDENNEFATYAWVLRDAAYRTGGRVYDVHPKSSFAPEIRIVLAEFRSRYVLKYAPRSVDVGGWHELSVRVRRAGEYEIRARKGYQRPQHSPGRDEVER